ncbi:MAG: PD-(D/E)XK nuclease family protein [Rikenellaceae bacterium]
MRGFLNEVAERLYNKYGSDISSLKLVFPSRRSRIFFTEALSEVATEPLWQPTWRSLDELMAEATTLRHGDNIRLIAELYRIYSVYHAESFDKFYFWGEILLSDFDMIDKYMVDADMLFSNVADLKVLESDISYMTPEQLKIISFWSSLQDGRELSKEKQRFLKVWESLPKIYHQFRARLTELGIAYTGMIQRSAVERLQAGEFSFEGGDCYAVVGFNALSECEKRLFDALTLSSSVDFFWDYDNYYTTDVKQEAGLFIRENLVRYGSQFDISHQNFNSTRKEFNVVAAASNVLQCKYASKIISDLIAQGGVDKNTAIVLTDENLLTPLLYALPSQAGKVNVTMGYPLKQSLAYSLVERLLALQSQAKKRSSKNPQFYYVDVVALLSHPYINVIDKDVFAQIESQINLERLISVDRATILSDRPEHLSVLFEACDTWQSLSQYLQRVISFVAKYPYEGEDSLRRLEFLATISENILTLHNSLESCAIDLSLTIYLSLLRRLLQSLRVPFEGEPLEGLQIMGILETRNLDFRNVIILSMNDDNFPGNRLTTPSYVPYNIRAAYGVPTPEHHEGVFAYYFYRLIQRAEKVWMLYCSHADDKTTGEASRYIYQMDYESPFKLQSVDVGVDVNLYEQSKIEVAKEGEVDKILSRYTDSENPQTLSPSAINRYVACPLRFYFQHIAHIKGGDELTEDVDNSMFGNILHGAIHRLYEPLIGEQNISSKLDEVRQDKALIEREVIIAMRDVCKLRESVVTEDFAGDLLLIKDIVVKYIMDGVMAFDAANSEFEVFGTEQKHSHKLELASGESVVIEGTLDRVDRLKSGRLRVVDYKTGGKHLEFKSIDSLFNGEGAERQGHIIQTLTYSMLLHHSLGVDVVPSLYYVRFMHNPTYSPLLVDKSCNDDDNKGAIATYKTKSEAFEEHLTDKLSELLDRSIPFRQAEDVEGTCTYCDFRPICRV